MRSTLRAEFFKTVRRPMTYILLGTLAALISVYYLLLWLRIQQGPGNRRRSIAHWLALKHGMSFETAVPYALQLERFFVTLICVIFVAAMLSNEYDWRTAALAMSRGVRRYHFIASKAIVAVLFTVTAVLVGFSVGLAFSAWFSHVYHLPYGALDAARLGDAFASIARTTFVVLPFVAMALFFSTVWRSTPQAAGFALGFFFLESLFTGVLDTATGFLSHVPEALVNANALSVMGANGLVPDNSLTGPFGLVAGGGGSVVPVWRAAGVLVLWIVAFGSIAFWRFRRRDLGD
ncbi:MAG TPA: ABC transporter permease subunit [Tepidiformaceae bacterium]|jgi:ABC-type transport system involved in multi-copper enzyme maturation permease subunit